MKIPAGDGAILIVVPTLDEAAYVGELIQTVLGAEPRASVLVVDDGSKDGTLEIVARLADEFPGRVNLLARQSKQGLGKAYIDGFTWGLERGFDYFVEIDADGSHDPSDVGRLISLSALDGLVIGSRYVSGGAVQGWSRRRHLLSQIGNVYASALLGFKVKDSTSGFRCYGRQVLESLDLGSVESEGYGFQIEMTYLTWQEAFQIVEVPIVFKERKAGKSKMSGAIVREALLSVARWGMQRLSDRLMGKRKERPRHTQQSPKNDSRSV